MLHMETSEIEGFEIIEIVLLTILLIRNVKLLLKIQC